VIETTRLKLVPATIASVRAEIDDRHVLAQFLGATVPENWPPETLVDALPLFLNWMEAAPDATGWFGWYALAPGDPGSVPTLVGAGGFKGPPKEGTAETGYSVLPQFQGHGFATEMVIALVRWALNQPGVNSVIAETEWANPASVRVLTKAGFAPCGPATEPGGTRYQYVGGREQGEPSS
jgi:RimJ/RimL family protein N-acetyltransferase